VNVRSSPDQRKCDNVLTARVIELGYPVSRNGGMMVIRGNQIKADKNCSNAVSPRQTWD